MNSNLIILLFCSFFSIRNAFAQGAIDGYMKAKKEIDFALTYSSEGYDQYWFGDELTDRSLDTKTLNLFVASGIGKNANLILSLPYMWTEDEQRFQDAIFAFKFRNKYSTYTHGNLSKITAIGFSFPIGDYDLEVENPIGEKAVAFQLRHLYQYNNNSGFFAQIQSGFDFRVIPDGKIALPVIFRSGWAAKHFYFDVWLDFFHTFSSGVNTTITDAEGAQFFKIGGTFYYPFTSKLGAFIGAAQFLSGKNIGKGTRLNFGGVYKLSSKD